MTVSLKSALTGFAMGVCLVPAAMAQAGNCSALKTQTDTLVQSYASTAAGLRAKLETYSAQSEALGSVYAAQGGKVELFQSIAAGTNEGSASDVLSAEEGRLDEAAMRETAAKLTAAIDSINAHLDTLAVQKPAMEAALGILQSQCPDLGGTPAAPAEVQTASISAPAVTLAAGTNPQAGRIPTVFTNFWKHELSGRVYEGSGQELLRNGKVAVSVDCDGFGTVREQPGKLCEGDWYDQSGNKAGRYRAVYVINSATKLPMLHGELTTLANPTVWNAWDFYEMTQDQAEQAGLIEIAP